MSPEMKEDSDCFLTVSFHIRLMRLCVEKKATTDQGSTWCRCFSWLLVPGIEWLCAFVIQKRTCIHDSTDSLHGGVFVLQCAIDLTAPKNGCEQSL